MRIDIAGDREMISNLRRNGARGPWLQLLAELLQLAGEKAEFLRHAERPWASATFSGTRHTVAFRFSGVDGVAAGEAYITALPDHEFTLPGQIVAEATVTAAEHDLQDGPNLMVEADLLLLKDD